MTVIEFILEVPRLLAVAVVVATPLALGAYSGLFCERAGVVNIGIEGMMLSSALTGQLVAQYVATGWIGTPLEPYGLPFAALVGILTGAALGALHAVLTIRFKVDQIISGTAINILAVGGTGALYTLYLAGGTAAGVPISPGVFEAIRIPFLADIPILGPIFFDNKPITYAMLIITVLAHFVIFHTPWGLRTRAVGEKPEAADSLGINVYTMRYINVIIGGALAGLAGIWFTLEDIGTFNVLMTGGRGFISLAALIFGKWTAFGGFGASLIFGFAQAVQIYLQNQGSPIPPQFLNMVPYVLTMLVLAGLIGRAVPPAADGVPYEK
ncbi:MAG: ABC transporter permease [Chloroflexi bacterium]|nr:ABC transporter permease [Chloroflexota bacterium]